MNAIAQLAWHSLFYKSNSVSGTILRSAEGLSMSSSSFSILQHSQKFYSLEYQRKLSQECSQL